MPHIAGFNASADLSWDSSTADKPDTEIHIAKQRNIKAFHSVAITKNSFSQLKICTILLDRLDIRNSTQTVKANSAIFYLFRYGDHIVF